MEDLPKDMREKKELENSMRLFLMPERIRKAKKEGRIVEFLGDLKCDMHSDAKFITAKEGIPGSYIPSEKGKDARELNRFFCEECGEEPMPIIPGWESSNTQAYECNYCGIVVGSPEIKPYNDIDPEISLEDLNDLEKTSGQPLAGRKGVHYHCNVCKSQIGHYYIGFS